MAQRCFPIRRRSLLVGGAVLAVTLATRPVLAHGVYAPIELALKTPEGRAIPVTQWLPSGKRRGTILFSHGAASSPRYYDRVIYPWVSAGWRVLAPMHVDSAEHPDTKNFPGLTSWKARVEDMRALVAHIGDEPFVAAGHSYGGLTATMLGGAQPVTPEGLSLPLVPRLATAVIALSPPPAIPVLVTQEGYGKLSVPSIVQTGTLDIMPGMPADGWKGHLAAFEAPAVGGSRYGLVLEGANHYFGGAICDFRQPGPPQLVALELANQRIALFLEGYGAGSTKARRHLDALVSEALPAQLTKR